jgi:hypothetical protein
MSQFKMTEQNHTLNHNSANFSSFFNFVLISVVEKIKMATEIQIFSSSYQLLHGIYSTEATLWQNEPCFDSKTFLVLAFLVHQKFPESYTKKKSSVVDNWYLAR